jgi:hypothetical protein
VLAKHRRSRVGQLMKRIQYIISLLIILLGMVHITFAFPIDRLTEGTLWFIGSGVALILAGLINWIASDSVISQKTKWIAFVSNILMASLFILAIPIVEGPQVFIGVGLFALAALLVITPKK